MDRSRSRVVDGLVAELGRAAAAVHAAERAAGGDSDLRHAHESLDEATGLVASIARGTEADLRTIAAAWEAIAQAHDTASRAREAAAVARQQHAESAAIHGAAKEQGVRARRHADRILRWWGRQRGRLTG
jgi:hypothetical protein